jgi:cytidine deaminase
MMSANPLAADPATAGVLSAPLVAELRDAHGYTTPVLMEKVLPFAAALAQPVISAFHVGVVALGTSGAIYYGANMEFPGQALSLTLHAEQSATTNAWNNGETGLSLLAVTAAPCGSCRQFLYEIDDAAHLRVLVAGRPPTTLSPGLLPAPFGPSDLGVAAALMAPQSVRLELVEPTSDPLVRAALAAAELSYAPYTGSHAGVAVRARGGDVHAGRLAENAAHNPGISPMEAAMAMAGLAGVRQTAIEEVALVQLPAPAISQTGVTEAVAAALGVTALSVHTAVRAP